MRLKKINAGLALITAAFVLVHITYTVLTYLMFYFNEFITHMITGPLMTLTIIHAALGVYAITRLGDGTRYGCYPRQNAATLIQRISGFFIIPIVFVHVRTFSLFLSNLQAGRMWMFYLLITVQILFFGILLTHVALSVPRAMITLGLITSVKTHTVIKRAVLAVCIILFVTAAFVVTRFDLQLISMAGAA